ncbi:MAG: hypothetical protein HYX95_00670, partial [Chloroflexi bacterium]|nr:hypothetical protein [Chloroflexota bacterium]
MDIRTLGLIAFILALFALSVLVARYRMKKAGRQVIETFIQREAIGADKALPLEELGLRRRGFLTFTRDYRMMALQAFISSGLVRTTEDGKYYLTAEAHKQ